MYTRILPRTKSAIYFNTPCSPFLVVVVVVVVVVLLPLALQPAVGFGLSNNTSPFFSYLSPTLSIFLLPALEDLFLLLLSVLSRSSSSSRLFQFWSEDLFVHPILLNSLQVT
jgi:hypothetical protein